MDHAKYERHIAIANAHMTLAQAEKYPELVSKKAIKQAEEYLHTIQLLQTQMTRSTTPQVPA